MLQVYILKCSDGLYYTGVSNDVESRVYEHNNSEDTKSFTYSRRPVTLAWVSEAMGPNQAIEFEKQIKGWRREKKEALINGQWELLHMLAKRIKKSEKKKK